MKNVGAASKAQSPAIKQNTFKVNFNMVNTIKRCETTTKEYHAHDK